MKSSFFSGDACAKAAAEIKDAINAAPDFLSALTASSPRATGDALQKLIEEKFESIIGGWCAEYSSSFARRAMADLAFRDREGFYCIADVKTHRQETKFNMPALVSVERLARFYEDDMNIFSIIMVRYDVVKNRVPAHDVLFCPIEFLDWGCLTIGALGWGQIQIADSNKIDIHHGQSRKSWMLALCDAVPEFYPREILKIGDRVKRFDHVKTHWQNKPDVWA